MTNPSGYYFMEYSGQEFEYFVETVFKSVIPSNMYDAADLEKCLKLLKLSTILPKYKADGTINKNYTRGQRYLALTESTPEKFKSSPRDPSEYQRFSSGSQAAPYNMGYNKKYVKHIREKYHELQKDLLELLSIDCDNDGNMIDSREQKEVTTEVFIPAIDEWSISFITKYKDVSTDLSLDDFQKLAKLCFDIMYKRLIVQAYKMNHENNFLKHGDWQAWQQHARVVGSFAVLLISLQMWHTRIHGTFHEIYNLSPCRKGSENKRRQYACIIIIASITIVLIAIAAYKIIG